MFEKVASWRNKLVIDTIILEFSYPFNLFRPASYYYDKTGYKKCKMICKANLIRLNCTIIFSFLVLWVFKTWVLIDVLLRMYIALYCPLFNQCFSLGQCLNIFFRIPSSYLSIQTAIHRDRVCEHSAPLDLLTQGPHTTHAQTRTSQWHYRGSCTNGCHVQLYQIFKGPPYLFTIVHFQKHHRIH